PLYFRLECHAVVTQLTVRNRNWGLVRSGGMESETMVVSIPNPPNRARNPMRSVAAVLLMFFSSVPFLQACAGPEKDANKLAMRQDGDDVVLSTTVTSSAVCHVVLTSYNIDANKHATLKYFLIESEEQVRCLSPIKVEWRLKGVRLDDLTFRIQRKQSTF